MLVPCTRITGCVARAGDGGGVLPTKLVELMAIAIDASCIHLYTPGIRRHIQRALALGATVEEIMEVLKLCGAQGVDACELKAPILSQELATRVPQEGGPEREA